MPKEYILIMDNRFKFGVTLKRSFVAGDKFRVNGIDVQVARVDQGHEPVRVYMEAI